MKRTRCFWMLLLFLCFFCPFSGHAAETVGIAASYANPFTGQVEDSGSDTALGQSMAESVLESQAVYEHSGQQSYVTIRIHLADQIGGMKFEVASADGHFQSVSGEEVARGGDYADIRLAVPASNAVLRIHLDVKPMGRTVVFFGVLDGSGHDSAEVSVRTQGQPSTQTPTAAKPTVKTSAGTTAAPKTKAKQTDNIETTDPSADAFGAEHGLLTKEAIEAQEASEQPPLGPISKALIYAMIVLLTLLALFLCLAAFVAVAGLRMMRRANDRKEAMLYDREDRQRI